MNKPQSYYRLLKIILSLVIVIIIGVIGYTLIEGWSFFDSLYMTITTISTVGFVEVHPLSMAGRIFTIFLILIGAGTLLYVLTSVVQYILEGEFGSTLWRRRMNNKISKLKNHFIICGYGRVGESVANTFSQQKVDFITIDLREDCVNRALKSDYLTIQGDATKNEILTQAQVETARGLVVCFGDDADNLYAILSARELNPALSIIARASSQDAARRMQLAGAQHVIAPEAIGGQRMARIAVRPTAVQFVETVFANTREEFVIEEIKASTKSSILGLSIKEIEDKFPRVKILALKSDDGPVIINPEPGTTIESKNSLTAFGPVEQMLNLES